MNYIKYIINFLEHIWFKIQFGIQNLINWFPVIWGDRQYDQYYILVILRKKILLMLEDWERVKNTVELDEELLLEILFYIEKVMRLDNCGIEDYQEYKQARKILFEKLERNFDKLWY